MGIPGTHLSRFSSFLSLHFIREMHKQFAASQNCCISPGATGNLTNVPNVISLAEGLAEKIKIYTKIYKIYIIYILYNCIYIFIYMYACSSFANLYTYVCAVCVCARNSFHFYAFRFQFAFHFIASPRLIRTTKHQQNIICLAFWLLRQSISVAPLAKYAINSVAHARIISTICVHSIIGDVPVCM